MFGVPSTSTHSSHYLQAYTSWQPPVAQTSITVQDGLQHLPNSPPNSTWYSPGHHRCTYGSCQFVGSVKSLEVHRMDRHLIYPPGWSKANKATEWDADPSLKGKPIFIQGTKFSLNTPEAIESWIAERKKRWPSSALVKKKTEDMEEAIKSGQLTAFELGLQRHKRRRDEPNDSSANYRNPKMRRFDIKGKNGVMNGQPTTKIKTAEQQPSHPTPGPSTLVDRIQDSNEEDDDDAPECASSKLDMDTSHQVKSTKESNHSENKDIISNQKRRPPHSHSHHVSTPRAPLLLKLLQREIQMTVSNLSQAIRFLVDNDFLDGVEEKPGEGQGKIVEVLST